MVSFNTYGPESGLDSVPGIWAPKRARIPAQKNRRSGPYPSQKTGRLLLHSCLGNLTSSMALFMVGPPPCCRYLGGTYKPSSPLCTASLGAVEALVCSSGTAAAPAQQVTTLHRQKRIPDSGHDLRPVSCMLSYSAGLSQAFFRDGCRKASFHENAPRACTRAAMQTLLLSSRHSKFHRPTNPN